MSLSILSSVNRNTMNNNNVIKTVNSTLLTRYTFDMVNGSNMIYNEVSKTYDASINNTPSFSTSIFAQGMQSAFITNSTIYIRSFPSQSVNITAIKGLSISFWTYTTIDYGWNQVFYIGPTGSGFGQVNTISYQYVPGNNQYSLQ